jgi:hypothetical protein
MIKYQPFSKRHISLHQPAAATGPRNGHHQPKTCTPTACGLPDLVSVATA